jgi:ABC-type nitrate/sulfonate/bicarbonate transport system permease component
MNMNRAGLIRLLLVVAALALLEAACRAGWIGKDAVIPPTVMAEGAWRALRTEETRGDLFTTLHTVGLALGLSLIAGAAIGALLHRLPRLRRVLDPLLASYYAVQTFVFYPLFIVMFGLNRWPLVAIGFLFAVVAVAINTLDGLSRIPRAYRRAAAVMRLSPAQSLIHVILPAASPWFFTGAKFAVAYSFIGVIAGEFVVSGEGIGHAIAFAYNSFDNRMMYGLIVLLFLVVGGINTALWSIERRLYARLAGR